MLHLSVFSFFIKSANLTLAKEHLIQEVAKMEERRAANAVPEEAGAVAEPVSKAPRSSLDCAFEEILQERQSQVRSVREYHISRCAGADLQYLSEQTTPKKSNPLQY